ncbi:MAG: sialate O-acetylesterase, partial [Opitutaceae bacterium]|nr:sialate O-acetylesterase [Opitutaceae bacterium]
MKSSSHATRATRATHATRATRAARICPGAISTNNTKIFLSFSCFILPLLLFIIAALSPLRADVQLAMPFGDGAVLQRDKPIDIWGQADPGENVSVSFASHTVTVTATATADAGGRWRVRLPALAANATPADMVITGKNTVILKNLLIGDVWLCAGQSNMVWKVNASDNATAEMAAADYPGIRLLRIDRVISDEPAATAVGDAETGGGWRVCTPNMIWTYSAVAYFFARDIYKATGVPIGIIQVSWSGAAIESFMSVETLAGDPAFAVVRKRWQKTLAATPDAKGGRDQPSGIYNGMVAPLAPCGLRGFLWYQGEANAKRSDEYHALFASLITSWRAAFQQGDLPFYWVQLPNFKDGNGSSRARAFLREAQERALSFPATGQAVTIDIGDPDNEHPTNKQEVSRRLSLIALANDYNNSVVWQNPRFVSARPEGAGMRVTLEHSKGLAAIGDALPSFEVAGADRQFYPASMKIEHTADESTLFVSSPQVTAPVAVRYAWFNDPRATLRNDAGLPLAPFRNDNWGPATIVPVPVRPNASAPYVISGIYSVRVEDAGGAGVYADVDTHAHNVSYPSSAG